MENEKRKFDKKPHGDFKGKKPFNKDRKDGFKKDDRKDNFKPRRNFDKKDQDFKKKDNFRKDDHPVDKEEKKNVRYYVYNCLYNIYVNKSYVNIDIDHTIQDSNMSDLDKRLFTRIVYGTLQNEKRLVWEMRKLSEKEPKDEARILILMSLYQLNFLDRIPQFAIINEAVEIAKKINEGAAKYVNAVLREATRQNLKPTREDFKDELEYQSIMFNTPVWVIKMLNDHYGKEKTQKILESNIQEAPLSIRVNLNNATKEEILALPNFVEGKLAKNSLIYEGEEPLFGLDVFKEGKVSVQDESSQYVVEVLDPQENEHILDMCAAPGSKTQYIATLMKNTGKILALDIHEHRVDIMKKYLHKLGITNTTCICFDSTLLSTKEKLIESFDRVLLDAPCLGLGVVRRKPDILLELSPNKLDELNAIQEKLLAQAYKMLKHGGTLVYSTCSINKKENDSQITRFLANHPDMKRVSERQIFPYEFNSDGFYIAKLIKE